MNKYTLSVIGFCAAAGLLVSTQTNAQIFFNNGAQVYAAPNSIVQVNGGFQDDNAVAGIGTVDNEGDMTVTSNGAAPGNIWISNNATLQGNGKYHLEQNWINDATFTCNNSTVDMYGSTAQYITSNNATVTTFDTLLLQDKAALAPYGSLNARKIQTLDANVQGALLLNDRTLWTQNHTMFITTNVVNAVTNTPGTEGFVRSDLGGTLSRVTNSVSRYFFPVGSDSGTLRYRPVYMTPQAAAANTYTVRMANYDATTETYNTSQLDTTICQANKLFYHQIDRPVGASNADVDIYFKAGDGPWTGIAQWNTPTAAVWNDMGLVTATVAAWNDNLKPNWANFSSKPYILDNVKPSAPVINCPSICAGADAHFTATGSGNSFTWTNPGGTTIINGQGTDSLNVKWGNIPDTIKVVTNSVGGCASRIGFCVVGVNPSPTAIFDTVSSGMFHNDWGFTDQSLANIVKWDWHFGDGDSSNLADPAHIYNGAGTYIVTEVVTNSNGCSTEKIDTVVVPEGFYIPNIITPNGDGKNDVFTISCSGVRNFNLQVFNRWGELMFTSNALNIAWDGRTNAGVKVSDGTYYYILKATSMDGKDWDRKGTITVLSTAVNQ